MLAARKNPKLAILKTAVLLVVTVVEVVATGRNRGWRMGKQQSFFLNLRFKNKFPIC